MGSARSHWLSLLRRGMCCEERSSCDRQRAPSAKKVCDSQTHTQTQLRTTRTGTLTETHHKQSAAQRVTCVSQSAQVSFFLSFFLSVCLSFFLSFFADCNRCPYAWRLWCWDLLRPEGPTHLVTVRYNEKPSNLTLLVLRLVGFCSGTWELQSVTRCMAWILLASDTRLRPRLKRKICCPLDLIWMARFRTSGRRQWNDDVSPPACEQTDPVRQWLKMDCDGKTQEHCQTESSIHSSCDWTFRKKCLRSVGWREPLLRKSSSSNWFSQEANPR